MNTKLIINETEITSIYCENCCTFINNDESMFPNNWLDLCCSTKVVNNRCVLETKGNMLVKSHKMYDEDWDSDEDEDDDDEDDDDEDDDDEDEDEDEENEDYEEIKKIYEDMKKKI